MTEVGWPDDGSEAVPEVPLGWPVSTDVPADEEAAAFDPGRTYSKLAAYRKR